MSLETQQDELAELIRETLADLLLQGEKPSISSAGDISNDRDFREYGLTSVDFLEFVLLLEQKLGLEIPDSAFTEVSLLTVDDWVKYFNEQ